MPTKTLLARVHTKMRETGANQSDVAQACGVSQPHISKVLNRKVKLAEKTSAALGRWLDQNQEVEEPSLQTLEVIAAKLNALGPKRRMQFMQLLAAIDGLLGR